ncbi:MAG TPA: hypothetical protein V6D03_01850, partial [Candidatus Caenarcaniphilales bacterium]
MSNTEKRDRHIAQSQELAQGAANGKMRSPRVPLEGSPSPRAFSPKTNLANEGSEIFPAPTAGTPDLVCLSHLRWNFVYQRPQHLLSRCAQKQRVFFIEEPLLSADTPARLDVSLPQNGVCVVVPHLSEGLSEEAMSAVQQELLERLFVEQSIHNYILWYYTPMAMSFTRHLKPLVTVYDCMDELSAFKQAPPALRKCEAELFSRADLVFTGGQ